MKTCKSGRVIIKKRMGKEWYVLRLNLVDYESGKPKYTTKEISPHLEVGKRNYQKAIALLDDAITSYQETADTLYFHNYCKEWLNLKRATIEITTFEGYQYRIGHIIDYFSSRKILLNELCAEHIRDFYHYLLVSEHTVGNKQVIGYSNRTIKDTAALLKSILNEAKSVGHIKENPAESIKVPKKTEDIKTKSYIDTDTVSTFLDTIHGHRLEVPFILALYYGLRREEILGLKWSSIHEDGRLYIEHTVARLKTTIRKDRVKTHASYRSYPISDQLLALLNNAKRQQALNRRIYGDSYHDSDYVFTWEDGHLYSPDYLTKSFKKVVRSSPDLDDSLTLHSLRASCVSILIHEGIDIKDVQEWVGHKDIQTTLNIYARTNEKEKRKVDQKMSQTFFKDDKKMLGS